MDTTLRKNPAVAASGLILLLSSSAHFINDFIQSVVPAAFPIMQQSLGFSFFEIGLIAFFLQLTSSVFQPFIGLYNDQEADKNLLLYSGLCSGIGMILFSLSESVAAFIPAVSAIGFGSALFHPTMSKIAQSTENRKRGLNQAVFQVGGNAGGIFGSIAAALFLIPLGLGSSLWFGLAAFLIAGASFLLPTKSNSVSSKKSFGFSIALLKEFLSQSFIILFILMFSKQIYTASITNFLSFYLIEKFGISLTSAQYYLFLVLAAGVVGTLLGGFCTDRCGKKKMILFSILGAAPFALLIPFTDLFFAVVLAALVALIVSSAFSAILVYAFDLMPNNIGAVSGIFFGLCFGLGGIGTLGIGLFADTVGIQDVFLYIAFLPLIGILGFCLPSDRIGALNE